MLGLIKEAGVFLIAFGGEADVVELNLIRAGLGYELGEGDVELLHFGLRGVGPDQLAVFTPGLFRLSRLRGQFGMLDHHALVAKNGDAGYGVHILRVQEVNKLRQVVNVNLMLAEKRVLEGNGDAAVGIFDVEDHGVAADLAPVADDSQAVIAGGHDAGEVDRSDFKIFGDGNSFFDDGRGKNSGDRDLLAVFQYVGGALAVDVANSFGEFGRSQVASLLQILPSHRRDAFSALGRVSFSSGNGWL